MAAAESPLIRRVRALFLETPRLTLAVAESLTCGNVQAAIGAMPGASDFFLGGITAYAIPAKVRHLGVDEAEAVRCDAVSASIARQMAVGACRLFGSDVGAATTGYAQPEPSRGFVVPTAFFAVATRKGKRAEVALEGFVECPGLSRVAMQKAVTLKVLVTVAEAVRELRRR